VIVLVPRTRIASSAQADAESVNTLRRTYARQRDASVKAKPISRFCISDARWTNRDA
jgi:hypothetical protein